MCRRPRSRQVRQHLPAPRHGLWRARWAVIEIAKDQVRLGLICPCNLYGTGRTQELCPIVKDLWCNDSDSGLLLPANPRRPATSRSYVIWSSIRPVKYLQGLAPEGLAPLSALGVNELPQVRPPLSTGRSVVDNLDVGGKTLLEWDQEPKRFRVA